MKLTPDIIVATGLVAALILNIVLGGESQITMNISTGLVGWLGKITFWPSAKGVTDRVTDRVTDGVTDNVTDKGVDTK